MADTGKPIKNAAPDKSTPHWWWHDDDYIANDTWNWLAICEVVVAFCFFYWVAFSSSYPWLTVLSFVSTPLLLLRSEASIQRGIKLLSNDENKQKVTVVKIRAIDFGGLILIAGMSYWLTDYLSLNWWIGQTGWTLLLRTVITGAAAVAGAFVYTMAITIAITGAGLFTDLKSVAVACVVAIMGVSAFELVTGAIVGAVTVALMILISSAVGYWVTGTIGLTFGTEELTTEISEASETLPPPLAMFASKILLATNEVTVAIISAPATAIGMCMRAVYLRFRATCTPKHLRAGFAAYSHNWYETVLVSNVRHAPALLPGAGQVNRTYNAASLSTLTQGSWLGIFIRTYYTISYFLFATIYRWNIKANAWIWAPLAYLLRRVEWERHPLAPVDLPPDSRRKVSAFWSNRYVVTTITIACGVLSSYLLYPYFDSDLQKILSNWAPLLVKYLPIEKVGIRYVLLWLFALSLVIYLFFAVKLKSDYYKILEEHDKHQKLPLDQDKSMEPIFEADAKRFVRIRWFTVASFMLFTYSVLLQFFILKWPEAVGNTVWSWVKHWL